MTLNRVVPLFIVLVAIGALAMGLTAEIAFKLEPCILCLYQRVPYVAVGLLALLALKLPAGSFLARVLVGLCGLVFLSGAAIAVYHTGVEQHWWVSGCSGQLATGMSLDDLRTSLMSKPEKACDDVDWTLFGISFATYNAAFSGVLGLLSLAAAKRMKKNT